MNPDHIFKGLCAAVIAVMLIYYIRREKKLISLLFGSLSGIAGLLLLNKYGTLIGAEAPLNAFNTAASCVLGLPYVICLAVMNHF